MMIRKASSECSFCKRKYGLTIFTDTSESALICTDCIINIIHTSWKAVDDAMDEIEKLKTLIHVVEIGE